MSTTKPTGRPKLRTIGNRNPFPWLPDEPAGIAADVRQLVADLMASGRDLSATDRTQLLDYFSASQREAKAKAMLERVTDDPAMWLRIAAQVDKSAGLKRALLRDLRLTRSALASGGSAAQSKADGKSGSQWKGIL